MKKNINIKKEVQLFTLACTFCSYFACSKSVNMPVEDSVHNISDVSKLNQINLAGDTILKINYESATENSGIEGVTSTYAAADDAADMVSPGSNGSYAISHKVTLGSPGYWSANAYRSESDADYAANARFLPGNERRYEFSVLLKDWEQYKPGNPPYGDNIFQLKITSGDLVPVRILTKRNSIVTRNTTYQDALVKDFRPYINQWIHFRIDVKWANNNTGYLKIYTKLPNQTTYNLILNRPDYATYTGTGLSGQHGYLKWGVYREAGKDGDGNVITTDNALTRIAYHDDIHIISLN